MAQKAWIRQHIPTAAVLGSAIKDTRCISLNLDPRHMYGTVSFRDSIGWPYLLTGQEPEFSACVRDGPPPLTQKKPTYFVSCAHETRTRVQHMRPDAALLRHSTFCGRHIPGHSQIAPPQELHEPPAKKHNTVQ